jgi:hypothetical protein
LSKEWNGQRIAVRFGSGRGFDARLVDNNAGGITLELAPIGGWHMCQEPASRLCNLSERCHVRKVASLLARPLRTP